MKMTNAFSGPEGLGEGKVSNAVSVLCGQSREKEICGEER